MRGWSAPPVTTSLVTLVGLVLLAPWQDDGTTGTTAPAAEPTPYSGAVPPGFGAFAFAFAFAFAYQAGTTYECRISPGVVGALAGADDHVCAQLADVQQPGPTSLSHQ